MEVTNSTNLIFTQPHWERKRTGGEVGISIKKVSSKSVYKFQDATEPRAKKQEPRAKKQEPRTKSQEPRAKNEEPRYKTEYTVD